MSQIAARERLTRARAWVSLRYPFFGVLALHLPDRATKTNVDWGARTDGRTLEYDPAFVEQISDEEARGLLLHLVLHAAFGHPWRKGSRDAARWEIACDIVVNGVLRKLAGLKMPLGANATDFDLETEAVETVYDKLPINLEPPSSGTTSPPPPGSSEMNDLESYWSEARQAAMQTGDAPANIARYYPTKRSNMNWRDRLTRYLITATRDYVWNPPDRRMMAHDLIYPSLSGEAARVAIAVDTSGSVGRELIGAFMAEVQAIARSHPDVTGIVLYADAAVNEVHDLRNTPPPSVIGGGGTSFQPVLQELERRREQLQVLIYLTDAQPESWPPRPTYPVVWVVPDILENVELEVKPPFGEVLRISSQ
jgi:predicted metal-dependent peptidase